jgi:hypothetical protein
MDISLATASIPVISSIASESSTGINLMPFCLAVSAKSRGMTRGRGGHVLYKLCKSSAARLEYFEMLQALRTKRVPS